MDWLDSGYFTPSRLEDGFYERIKQSAGYMPASLLKKIEGRRAIWIHAASVGEIVATSPLVKEVKRNFLKPLWSYLS